MPPNEEPLHAVALAALILSLFGTYWDDAWHTDVGRDTFWSPPHILLYAGIAVASATIGLRALLILRAHRSIRSLRGERGLVMSLTGVAVTLASAPIDEIWHTLYGRDAVAWSPPHLLGLVGVLLIIGGILLDLRNAKTRFARALRHVASAGALAVLLASVFEYDSDVPQFDLVWYLPVLTFALTIGLGLVRANSDSPWAGSSAAFLYMLLMAATNFALLAIGFSQPILPMVAILALVDDVARARGARLPIRAALLALATWLLYPAYLSLYPGTRLGIDQVWLGLPMTILAAGAGLLAFEAKLSRGRKGSAAILAILLAFPTATAHDPGQGIEVAPIRLEYRRDSHEYAVFAELEAPCGDLRAASFVARRAGVTLESEVVSRVACRFEATFVPTQPGRWFGYFQFEDDGGALEAWIPIEPDAERAERSTSLYRPAPPSDPPLPSAVALYGASLGLLALLIRAHRSLRRS